MFIATRAGVMASKAPAAATDPNFANVSLLLRGDGPGFIDSSSAARTMTATGTISISSAQSRFGGASILCGGGRVTTPTNAAFVLSTGDFTIEFWAWKNANGVNGFDVAFDTSGNGSGNGGYVVELSGSRGFVCYAESGILLSHTMNPNDSTWHHYAIARAGSTLRAFVDGTLVTSATNSTNLQATASPALGSLSRDATPYPFAGHIDEFRLTKGVARYTASFTPPTAPFPGA